MTVNSGLVIAFSSVHPSTTPGEYMRESLHCSKTLRRRWRAGECTRSHPVVRMHELEPQCVATAAALVKAASHRYMQVRMLSCCAGLCTLAVVTWVNAELLCVRVSYVDTASAALLATFPTFTCQVVGFPGVVFTGHSSYVLVDARIVKSLPGVILVDGSQALVGNILRCLAWPSYRWALTSSGGTYCKHSVVGCGAGVH